MFCRDSYWEPALREAGALTYELRHTHNYNYDISLGLIPYRGAPYRGILYGTVPTYIKI
jgi:hypothetical protein